MRQAPTTISLIIPTKDSAKNLVTLLDSCTRQTFKNFEVIINDDPRSKDDIERLLESYASSLNLVLLHTNTSMAQGRLEGARSAKGDIFFHLDSDMQLTSNLLSECFKKISDGSAALVIPEESYGTTFWARCKWLEKKCYERNANIESLRCLRKDVYWQVGGHDPMLVFSEDKDLDLRVRATTNSISRTNSVILHNEGALTLKSNLRKKLGYSQTSNLFAQKHPRHYKWQSNIFNRYIIYAQHFKYIFIHPFLYVGLILMKTSEYAASFYGLIRHKHANHN